MKPLTERRRRSARELFSNCQHAYADNYIHDIDSGNSVTRRGSTFHRAREIYIRSLFASKQTDDFELATAAMTQALIELPLPYAEELDCADLWLRFAERFSLPLSQYYGTETTLMMFSTLLRYDLVLVPDANTLLIDDAKTNWQLPSQSALENAYQNAFYLSAARLLFPGFKRYVFRYDFVRFNQFRFVEKTDAEMDAFEEHISTQDEAMARAEELGAFPATAGAHCGTCLTAKCPVADNAMRFSGRLTGPAEASEAVRVIAALHRSLELRQEALRAYSAEHGPVTGSGIEWAHRPVEQAKYPAGAVLEVLESTGTVFPLYLSGSAVKPLLTSKRKYSAIAPAIKALAEIKVKTEFRPKVVVEAEEREYADADD